MLAETMTPVNYPQDRYAIEYEAASGLFVCRYGGEVFDRAANYADGDLQCGYHWIAQQALERPTYTVAYTGRQIIITASDGAKSFYSRTDKGWAAAERKIVKLQGLGYAEVQ